MKLTKDELCLIIDVFEFQYMEYGLSNEEHLLYDKMIQQRGDKVDDPTRIPPEEDQ